jgi:hypothetical protein
VCPVVLISLPHHHHHHHHHLLLHTPSPLPPGFKALCQAFTAVTGDCKPYSITGSLPCIRDLQEAGFDVQTLGFGKLAAYHSNNGEGVKGLAAAGCGVECMLDVGGTGAVEKA